MCHSSIYIIFQIQSALEVAEEDSELIAFGQLFADSDSMPLTVNKVSPNFKHLTKVAKLSVL